MIVRIFAFGAPSSGAVCGGDSVGVLFGFRVLRVN